MSNPQQITILLEDFLKENPLVLGLVLVGSQARENVYTAGKYSDMEAYIIVKDDKVGSFEEQLPKIVDKLGKVIFSYRNRWAGFSTVFEDLFRLELPIVKLSELSSVFSRPKAQTVKILIDKTNGELVQVLNSRPETIDFQKLFQDTILDFWYMAVVTVQYYKQTEVWDSRSGLQVLFSSLIKLMELLQDQEILLLETNKRVEQFLSSEQINLLRRVAPAYDRKQIENSLKEIIEIFSDISKEVAKKYNYTYRRDVENKIKKKLKSFFKKDFLIG